MRFLLAVVFSIPLLSGAWDTLEAKKIQLDPKLIAKAPVLHRLVADGNIDELTRILPSMSKHLNDTTDDTGQTALHWCVYCDNYNAAEKLLESGADVNHSDNAGITPVHESAKDGNAELTSLFIQSGSDLEARDTENSWNAFLWAVYSGNPELIKLFLTEWSKDSLNTADKRGNNAISVAAMAASARANTEKKTEQTDNYDLLASLRMLLDAGIDPNAGKALAYMPLNEIEAIKLLLEHNVDPNVADSQGITLLMRATTAGNIEVIELLIKHKADINTENVRKMTALNLVDFMNPNHKKILQLLLDQDIDTNSTSAGMLLNKLLSHGDIELLDLFIDKIQASGDTSVLEKIDYKVTYKEEVLNHLQDAGFDLVDASANSSELRNKRNNRERRTPSTRNRRGNKASEIPDFLRDLNAEAKSNKLPKLIGRETELDNVIRSLGRKVKNNPLLIGEAGVGKTAIVEGLVQLIVAGRVPQWLQGKNIYSLNMNDLVSGTHMHGALQDKINDLIDFFSNEDAILFIDEIHMIVGAGAGANSQMNVANSLKQALARGDISCIGATTHNEYQRYFANDQALERRFLPIKIDAPTLDETLKIVQGVKDDYEEFHDIEITDDSLAAVVEFANQYITDRYFPDKALDVLDAALAHLKMKYDSAADSGEDEDMERVLTREIVADSLAKSIGVSKEKMLQTRQESLDNLIPWLQERIFGQDEALEEISDIMYLANSGLKEHLQEGNVLSSKATRPTASMLFNGPTGVGKTETTKLFSEYLYNSNIVMLNMSEYSEPINTSKLTGAPPGYIGHDNPGLLTSEVRKHPYSVVLFDEIDKAHPSVITNILVPILSEGQLTDSSTGNAVSFKNTVVILTSNSSSSGRGKQMGFELGNVSRSKGKIDSKKINISNDVLSRLDGIITFDPISKEAVDQLLEKELKELNLHLQSKENISVTLSDAATAHLYENALNPDLGARSVRTAFTDQITLVLAKKLAKKEIEPGTYQIDFNDEEYSIKAEGD